jgi:hypothetical protein
MTAFYPLLVNVSGGHSVANLFFPVYMPIAFAYWAPVCASCLERQDAGTQHVTRTYTAGAVDGRHSGFCGRDQDGTRRWSLVEAPLTGHRRVAQWLGVIALLALFPATCWHVYWYGIPSDACWCNGINKSQLIFPLMIIKLDSISCDWANINQQHS